MVRGKDGHRGERRAAREVRQRQENPGSGIAIDWLINDVLGWPVRQLRRCLFLVVRTDDHEHTLTGNELLDARQGVFQE